MDKFKLRELKMSFFLANLMGLKNPTIEIPEGDDGEVVTIETNDGRVIEFNPFTVKSHFFDVYMWATNSLVNINAFKHNVAVKNTKTGQIERRHFEASTDNRTLHILEAVCLVLGYKE